MINHKLGLVFKFQCQCHGHALPYLTITDNPYSAAGFSSLHYTLSTPCSLVCTINSDLSLYFWIYIKLESASPKKNPLMLQLTNSTPARFQWEAFRAVSQCDGMELFSTWWQILNPTQLWWKNFPWNIWFVLGSFALSSFVFPSYPGRRFATRAFRVFLGSEIFICQQCTLA